MVTMNDDPVTMFPEDYAMGRRYCASRSGTLHDSPNVRDCTKIQADMERREVTGFICQKSISRYTSH